MAKESNAPFICVTESHLNPSILDAEISIPGYDVFRSDRTGRSHGGVVTYVRKDLVVKTEIKDSNSFCDSLVLHIPQLDIVLANIYRPPNCPEAMFAQTLEYASVFLRNLEDHQKCANTYLVVGDFNFPFLSFQEDGNLALNKCNKCVAEKFCTHTTSEKRQAQMLLDFSNEFFMEQYIKKPTRNKNILDLCFTNDQFLVHGYQMIVNSKLSDHYTILINLNYEKISKPERKKRTNQFESTIPEYDLAGGDDEDWIRINLLLDKVNWESLLENLSPEESVSQLLSLLEEKVSQVFNKQTDFLDNSNQPSGKFKNNNKIPRKIRNLMRQKTKLSKSILKAKSVSRCLSLREKLEKTEVELKSSYEKRRSDLEKKAIEKIKKNPKYFFSYAKRFSKVNSDIGPFFDRDGEPVLDGKEIVDMLRSQYESVFSSPMEEFLISNPQEFFSTNEESTQLDSISFTRDDVVDKIDCLSAGASAGPDGIPAILLKRCKYSLADGLVLIFEKFLKEGKIPEIFKKAFIIPIHKGGSRGSPENFRPVSLTSHIMKTFERVIRQILVNHLEVNSKLNPNQHGFRSRRSCLSQLLEHQDRVLSILEEGHNVDSIYLDFSKAFDKVDTGILCHKLRRMGISGKLGILIHNFLTNRKQTVLANGIKSVPSDVKSGVPQGTVLGPVLFLILINDIDENIDSSSSLFADDTRVTRKIDSEDDVEELQKDLDKLYEWQEQNNMLFNGKKFEVMRYGPNTSIKESTSYFTPNLEDIIEEKDSLRDLGIIMSNDGAFSSHVELVCGKVKQKSSWILRTFQSRNTWFMKYMWKTLVQCHIDYCSQLYLPGKPADLERLENLQRCFTKKIPEVKNLDYWQRLKKLKMLSQERRMERYRAIYVWKIIEGMVPNCGLDVTDSDRRGREIAVPHFKGTQRIQTLREMSFQVNGARIFNSLPKAIRNLRRLSVVDFKSKLDEYLQTLPDEPKLPSYIPGVCNQITASPSNSIIDHAKAKMRRPGQ